MRRSAHKRDGKGRPIGKVLLDRKKIADARRNAGKSVIGTDVLTKDPVEVDEVYRSLFKIEEVFRCLKSTVKLGPIRHRRADRVQAHLSLAVMAFNLGRWLRHKSGMTLERLQRVFANARVQKVKVGTAEYWERVNLEKEQLAVLGKMGYAVPPKRFTVTVAR